MNKSMPMAGFSAAKLDALLHRAGLEYKADPKKLEMIARPMTTPKLGHRHTNRYPVCWISPRLSKLCSSYLPSLVQSSPVQSSPV